MIFKAADSKQHDFLILQILGPLALGFVEFVARKFELQLA